MPKQKQPRRIGITIHSLKCLPEFFQAIVDKDKTFELREDDRGFEVGDVLVLNEWEHEYTGRVVQARVKYILRDCIFAGLRNGFCIMSIELI